MVYGLDRILVLIQAPKEAIKHNGSYEKDMPPFFRSEKSAKTLFTVHYIQYISDMWTKPDLWTNFGIIKNPESEDALYLTYMIYHI